MRIELMSGQVQEQSGSKASGQPMNASMPGMSLLLGWNLNHIMLQGELTDEEFAEYFKQYGDVEDSVVSQGAA